MAFQKKDLLPLVRGDDWTIKFTVKDSQNAPIDITGFTYWMTIKLDPDSADPGDAQAVVNPTGVDASSGIVYITFPSNVTSLLEPASYFYDLQQIDVQTNVTTLIMGKVKVVRDITLSII